MMASPKAPTSRPALANELRHQLASALSDFKAYDVPAICERIGLAGGTPEEAFSSKYKYAETRLAALQAADVLRAARALLQEEENFLLGEAANKVAELDAVTISEITRRRVVALFDNSQLCTEIDEVEFLRRVWPIDTMPSCYRPDSDRKLSDDIYQHTVNNYDWSNRELLDNLGIFNCSQAQFFKFLAAVTDPLAHKPDAQSFLVEQINAQLVHDGYKLLKVREQSGCPFYEVKGVVKGSPADASISTVLKNFDPEDIHGRWASALERRENDPPGAITLARTLLEDVCKWIIDEAGQSWAEKDDLPALYRKLSGILKLAPSGHTEDIFKQILGSCQSIVESLGALRNKLSDSHSPGPKRARPAPRHAELAVNLSGAMANFLISTWRTRQQEEAEKSKVSNQ